MNKYVQLFVTFLKIGAFTFGGGYAMIPFIQRETVEKYHWIEEKDVLDIIAVAESTPGPIAINAATFVGFHTAGVLGACCATLGVILPSFCIILIIASFLRQFESLELVKFAFVGVRVGVTALILKALVSMKHQCPRDYFSYSVMLGAFLLATCLKVNVLVIIIVSGLSGIVATLIQKKRGQQQ